MHQAPVPVEPSVADRVAMLEKQLAMLLRAEWLRLQGAGARDIAECCDHEQHPADLAEEIESLEAAKQLRRNS